MRAPEFFSRPTFWVWFHGSLVIVWVALIWPSVTIWRESLPYLVALSVTANVVGSTASWQAARADSSSPTCEDIEQLRRMLSAHDAVMDTKVDAVQRQLEVLVNRFN